MAQHGAVQALPVERAHAAARRTELDKESVSAKRAKVSRVVDEVGAVDGSDAKKVAKRAKVTRVVEAFIVVSSDDDEDGIDPTRVGEDAGVRPNAVAGEDVRARLNTVQTSTCIHRGRRGRNPDHQSPVQAMMFDPTIDKFVWRRGYTSFEALRSGELGPSSMMGRHLLGNACASAHNGASYARNREDKGDYEDSSDSESACAPAYD